jgi:hypothetical protein
MKYEPKTDQVEPTDALLDGDSEILKLIAANVPDFAGNWDVLWDNVVLRGELKEILVKFHLISEEVKESKGKLDTKEIKRKWVNWLDRELKKRKVNKGKTEFNPYGLSY